MHGWIDSANASDIRGIVTALGLEMGARGARSFSPCPACGATQRTPSRRRPACAISHNKWRHHYDKCEANGDVVDLVAYTLCSKRLSDCTATEKRTVREWFQGSGHVQMRLPIFIHRPERVPHRSLALMWGACDPVDKTPAVFQYLKHERALDPSILARLNVCRAVPRQWDMRFPEWWPYEDAPKTSGVFRLAVCALDGKGVECGFHARAIKPTPGGGKVRWAYGYESLGLVWVNERGRMMLTGEHIASTDELWVCEGITDFLSVCQRVHVEGARAAVVGGTSGSWSALESLRLPDRVAVYVCMDPGKTGARYVDEIRRALVRQVAVVDMGKVLTT